MSNKEQKPESKFSRWEEVDQENLPGTANVITDRLRVPHGWLVRVRAYPINHFSTVNKLVMFPTISITFVADAAHKAWKL